MKAVNLAVFTLKEYFRGTFFFAETIVFAAALFLYSHYHQRLEASEVFLALGIFAMVFTVLITWRITNRETNPRIYVLLTKALTRREYIRGKALAAFILETAMVLLLFLLGFAFTKLGDQITLFHALARFLFIVLVILLTETIILFFTPLVRSRSSIATGLVLVITGFYQPIKPLYYFLPPIQQLIKSSYGDFSYSTLLWLLISGVYIVFFYSFTCSFFEKRELNYEPK